MSTRLLLDGTDLRQLMLRVRDEMGPGATIVRAERIRTGGIAGFFAREHYELTVEVPDPPARPPAHSRPAPTTEVERPDGHSSEPVGIEALMAAADALEAGPQVSTTTDSFAEVLASMQQLTGDRAAVTATGADASTADPLARPSWVPATPVVVRRPAASPTPEVPEHAALNELAALAAPGPGPAAPPPAATSPATPVQPAAASPAPPAARTRPAPEPVLERELVSEEDLQDAGRVGADVAGLLELGVPTRLLARFDDGAPVPLSALVRTFDRAPAPMLEPGSVVVVAGRPDLAVRTAVTMAHRAGLDAHEVVLAGDVDPLPGHGRRVLTTAAAARVRAKASQDVPTVVALGVGAPAAGALLLSAFEPDQAWAAVDARLRGVELRRWLKAVGARRAIDAVAAQHIFDAQSPGTVLNLGVPVGWVDGLPASGVVWAAVLGERLSDDARWD